MYLELLFGAQDDFATRSSCHDQVAPEQERTDLGVAGTGSLTQFLSLWLIIPLYSQVF